MGWGLFSYQGVGRPVFIDGIMDAAAYISILSDNLGASAAQMNPNECIFQQDNDPKQTSKLAQEHLDKIEGELFESWPSQSPDLNPIENFWYKIKVKVGEKQPKNIMALKEIIIEE